MKYIVYFSPIIVSFITYFSNKYLPDISKYFSIIPTEEKNNFNITFYCAIIAIIFQILKDVLLKILNMIRVDISVIAYEKNKTSNIDTIPEIIFNERNVSEVYFEFKIEGYPIILKKIVLSIDLPNWASFQSNFETNDNGCYELKIKEIIYRERQKKRVKVTSQKKFPIIFNPIEDELNSDKVTISIKGFFFKYFCNFQSNSFIIRTKKES
jgi:hypothetical protein